MHHEFTYRNTPADHWLFYMGNIYHQWTAVVNIVFTIAALILVVARFRDAHPVLQALMLMALFLFPVIQPLVIFSRAYAQARAVTVDTTLIMEDDAFTIRVKSHTQRIPWRDFAGVIARPGLIVLMPDEIHAYLLPDRVTGGARRQVLDDVRAALKRAGK